MASASKQYKALAKRYLRAFRTRILPFVHPRRRIDRLREKRTIAEQEAFYAR